jgi:hypothetical protein
VYLDLLQVAEVEVDGLHPILQGVQAVAVEEKVILQAMVHLLELLRLQQLVQVAVADLMAPLVVQEQVDL